MRRVVFSVHIFLFLSALLAVTILSEADAYTLSAGMKSRFVLSTDTYPGNLDAEYDNDSSGPFSQGLFCIGPSVNFQFSKYNSLSANLLFGSRSKYAYYTPYSVTDTADETDSTASSDNPDESDFSKYSIKNALHFEFYGSYNFRMNNAVTLFAALMYSNDFQTGDYSIAYSSSGDSDKSISGNTTDLYQVMDTYGAGGGVSLNRQLSGNNYVLTTLSYMFETTSLNIRYGDEHFAGTLFFHSPALKFGVAHFYTDSRLMIEAGLLVKYRFCQSALSDASSIKAVQGTSGISFGPVFNLSKTF